MIKTSANPSFVCLSTIDDFFLYLFEDNNRWVVKVSRIPKKAILGRGLKKIEKPRTTGLYLLN